MDLLGLADVNMQLERQGVLEKGLWNSDVDSEWVYILPTPSLHHKMTIISTAPTVAFNAAA